LLPLPPSQNILADLDERAVLVRSDTSRAQTLPYVTITRTRAVCVFGVEVIAAEDFLFVGDLNETCRWKTDAP
jgi:hypothetical protein